MPHINLFFSVSTALKNYNVAPAMLKFFALYKQKITGISNTAFYNQIGINYSDALTQSEGVTTKKSQVLGIDLYFVLRLFCVVSKKSSANGSTNRNTKWKDF